MLSIGSAMAPVRRFTPRPCGGAQSLNPSPPKLDVSDRCIWAVRYTDGPRPWRLVMETTYPLSGERTGNSPPSFGRRGPGDLLDQVFSLYRRGFPTFLAVTAVMLIPIAILALVQRELGENLAGSVLAMANGVLSLVYGVIAPAATAVVAAAL